MLVLPKPKTTTYGLNPVSYAAAKYWNLLPDSQALSNLEVHFLPIDLQIRRLLLLPVCVFM